MKTKTRSVAFGGVITALALALMLLAGVLPTASYSLAALAGMLLVPLVIEFGFKTSVSAFAAVGLLSMLLITDKEAGILFCCVLGWYPIAKAPFEKIKSNVLCWAVKLAVFNLALVGFYFLSTRLFFVTGFEDTVLGRYSIPLLWGLGNIAFIFYDIALSKLIMLYMRRLHDRLKKMIG
ncbi:MAG TPA: hypothetical protein PK854_07375 [Oscillospiraceae bacterium]|nr:hypothetical protein [Oscillospiraceae bacterium]HPS35070.1 hypothetical protein [Oscillospiraceae bacterium]